MSRCEQGCCNRSQPHPPPLLSPRPPAAATTRVQRNQNMAKLQAGYLFPEVRVQSNLILATAALNALHDASH